MRAVTNVLLAFLLMGALVWGNCFCCPQLPVPLESHAPAHGCCGHSGKQPVPSQGNCHSARISHFVTREPAPQVQVHVVMIAHVVGPGIPVASPAAPRVARFVIPHPPFDLEVLISNIRI